MVYKLDKRVTGSNDAPCAKSTESHQPTTLRKRRPELENTIHRLQQTNKLLIDEHRDMKRRVKSARNYEYLWLIVVAMSFICMFSALHIYRLRNTANVISQELKQLKADNNELSQQLITFTQTNSGHRQQVKQFNVDNHELSQQGKQLNEENRELSQQVKHLNEDIDELSQQLIKFTKENNRLSQQVKQFNVDNHELRQQVITFIQNNSGLSQQVKQVNVENHGLRQQVKQLNEDNCELSQQVKQLTARPGMAKKHNNQPSYDSHGICVCVGAPTKGMLGMWVSGG